MTFLSIFNLKKITPEQEFWEWFISKEKFFRVVELQLPVNQKLTNELSKRLKKVNEYLTWEFTTKTEPRDFVISADGIRDAFPAVISLVNSSPKLPEWRMLAFRQRTSGTNLTLSMGEIILDPQKIFFESTYTDDFLNLIVYVENLLIDNNLKMVLYLLFDSLIGEYDVETKIGKVDVVSSSEKPNGAKPLTELVGVIDAIPSLPNSD